MSVDLTSWLQALQAWQNSGHTESGWEDGPTVVWPLVFMLYLPLTSHTWQNPPVGFQTQLEQTFDISVKRSEATLETRPNSAEILVFSDRLNASLEQMRDANMPDDGTYDLEYTSKDGTLHHGTLCVDGHSVTVYDQDGKPVKGRL